jgi:tetratricopeptide (TPR) repeat protein
MTWLCSEPKSWPQAPGVSVLEANPGVARDRVVGCWLTEQVLADEGDRAGQVLRLRCRPEDRGPWAGLREFAQALVPSLRLRAPELLSRHACELCLVVPELRAELGFPQSLTDTVPDEEKTRNFAADRAYRCLHGLIDLVSEWHELAEPGPWCIACEDYEQANPLVRRFYAELVRRRGARLGLRLLAVVAPGHGDELKREFHGDAILAAVRLDLPAPDSRAMPAEDWGRLALELEDQLESDPAARELQFPRLIEAWRRSDTPARALPWELRVMSAHNHAGLYELSLRYAADVEASLDDLPLEDYLNAVLVLYYCYVPLDRAEQARALLERALTVMPNGRTENQFCYLLAMLYARFLKPADLAAAERLLQRALDVLSAPDIDESDRHFRTVFTLNGLAFVRMRQGRVQEAIDLCAAGFERLNEHLDPGRHRLHRSVLLFNIAQVHAHVGPNEDAIAYLSQAMAMDPNYSEYYNDRAAVYFKMGLLDEARSDYERAIALSPPYAEVWTNLGQCHREMERMDAAVDAYTRALDLDPRLPLALVGRAEALAALDRGEQALADYDRALTLEPDQPLVLAARAIARYELGRIEQAAADLDRAVELAPEMPELYQNRAVALRELGRLDDAASDLSTYVKLCPDADDRAAVEASLLELRDLAAAI